MGSLALLRHLSPSIDRGGSQDPYYGCLTQKPDVRWLDRCRRCAAQRKAKKLLQNVKAPNLEKGISRNMSCLAEWFLFLRTLVRMKGVGAGARDDPEVFDLQRGSSGCRREELQGGRCVCTWLPHLQHLV